MLTLSYAIPQALLLVDLLPMLLLGCFGAVCYLSQNKICVLHCTQELASVVVPVCWPCPSGLQNRHCMCGLHIASVLECWCIINPCSAESACLTAGALRRSFAASAQETDHAVALARGLHTGTTPMCYSVQHICLHNPIAVSQQCSIWHMASSASV